jgi:lipopolysaccharide transport system ATP-binding protein
LPTWSDIKRADVAVHCEDLGKRYRIGTPESYHALRDTIMHALHVPRRAVQAMLHGRSPFRAPDPDRTFWALKDVSLQIGRGEVVGIVGRNGAGKTTLLKILSRITRPTLGEARVYGRVGSLLEVGTGFHPELTGHENIYLNGAVLGLRKAEIRRKFDDIVAFAEVGDFIDTPVKRYSSGMHMRLAFAVAAHLDPEILFVDEVLAVGDAAFQRKCLGKMSDVSREGRTILFVSHNMAAVQQLCHRAVWLDEGRIRRDGPAKSVVAEYLQAGAGSAMEQTWPTIEAAPGNDVVRLRRVAVAGIDGEPGAMLAVHDRLRVEIEYWNLVPNARLNVCLTVYNQDGTCVFTTPSVTDPHWHGRPFPDGLYRSVCHVPDHLLNDGAYRVTVLLVRDLSHVVYYHEDVITFEICDSPSGRGGWYGKWIGAVRPTLQWETKRIAPEATNSTAAGLTDLPEATRAGDAGVALAASPSRGDR